MLHLCYKNAETLQDDIYNVTSLLQKDETLQDDNI